MTSVSKRLPSILITTITHHEGIMKTRTDTTTAPFLLSRWSWFLQVLWTFSVYLESVAIIPQLNLSSKVVIIFSINFIIIIIFSINLTIIITTLTISLPQIVATCQPTQLNFILIIILIGHHRNSEHRIGIWNWNPRHKTEVSPRFFKTKISKEKSVSSI